MTKYKAGDYCWVIGMSKETRGQIFLARIEYNVADWANITPLAASTKSLLRENYPAYTPQEDMKPFAWSHRQ